MPSEVGRTVLYRGKYDLRGLNDIPSDMMRDLDLAYEVCEGIRDISPCEMCGKCCHQPFITVRDEEVESISEYLNTDPLSFVMDYLERDDGEDRWLFRKTDPCAFLGEDNRCKIWGGRPEICREFPYLVSMIMSRVYLALVNSDFDIHGSIGYMDDSWACTRIIKENIRPLVEDARKKRESLLSVPDQVVPERFGV